MVPVGAETGPVTVMVNGREASNKPVFTVEALPSVISNVAPLTGKYNTLVTITGSNFRATPANNSVTFNGVSAVVESATATTLTVRVPLKAGSGVIAVNGVNAGGQFTYVPDIYISGYAYDNSGNVRATYWKNGVPTSLSTTGNTYAYDLVIAGDDVYAAGTRYLGTHSVARYWKNGVEMPLTNDVYNSYAEGIAVAGNDIYVAGYEFNASKSVAKYWKNGTPVNLSDGILTAFAYGITTNGQDIYVVGNSIHANGNTVATYWKNGVATQLTTGFSFAWDVFVRGNEVYSTGSIRNTGPGVGFVSYWKNSDAVLLGPGLGGVAGRDIVVVGDDVYVAGVEDNSKPIRVAEYWKNGMPVILTDGSHYAYAEGIDVLGEDDT